MTSSLVKALPFVALSLCLLCDTTFAENVDPAGEDSQYASGENVGWLNAEPLGDGGPGVEVSDPRLTGYLWAENIGWISLSCQNTQSCDEVDYGVENDGFGNLSGFAWGENVGWIDFAPAIDGTPVARAGVQIDTVTGVFGGLAWGENMGWINFAFADPGLQPSRIRTSWFPGSPTSTPTPTPTPTPTDTATATAIPTSTPRGLDPGGLSDCSGLISAQESKECQVLLSQKAQLKGGFQLQTKRGTGCEVSLNVEEPDMNVVGPFVLTTTLQTISLSGQPGLYAFQLTAQGDCVDVAYGLVLEATMLVGVPYRSAVLWQLGAWVALVLLGAGFCRRRSWPSAR